MSTRAVQKPAPLLVLALDGASFDVIHPMAERGQLPQLARWMASGISSPLPSTVPPVTFPAWSSFITGLEPGAHGIFDFTQKVPGEYRIQFVNASDRVGESLFARVSRAGGRVLVLGMPVTFPPEPLNGLLVPGFDAPVSTGSDPEATSDPDLYRRIAERAGPWMRPDLDETARDSDFHERAVATLLERIERKKKFALAALDEMGERPELAVIVFSESDTVGHHYFRDHDPNSPRHDPSASEARRNAISAVYAKLDHACGEIHAAFGEDARCIVVSDHGMGAASRWVVHLNRYLADCGVLFRRRGFSLSPLARAARDIAVSWLPPRLAQLIFRRARASAARVESAVRFSGFDWRRSVAFSEEANTQPGVWINLEGREARGCVPAEQYEDVRDQVIEALERWRFPADNDPNGNGSNIGSGERVVASARRREDVYPGPFADRAPDIVVELGYRASYGVSLVATPWERNQGKPALRRLDDAELAGGRGRGMNGTHRPDGIFIWASHSSVEPKGFVAPANLADVAPLILEQMGIEPAAIKRVSAEPTVRIDYSADEDERVAARLRALGYLE